MILFQAKRENYNLSFQEAETYLKKSLGKGWTAMGALQGPKPLVRLLKKELKRAIKPYGRLNFLTQGQVNLINKFQRFMPIKTLLLFKVFKELMGMHTGTPSETTITSFLSEAKIEKGEPLSKYVDRQNAGFIYCTPFAPLTAEDTQKLLKTISHSCQNYSFIPQVTLNILNSQILEAVVSISFDKRSENATIKAQQCIEDLNLNLKQMGYPLYRSGVFNFNSAVPGDAQRKVIDQIKALLDPQNILAPGRYENAG
jgi:4-cresol dehydrogenase (hydroxylating)